MHSAGSLFAAKTFQPLASKKTIFFLFKKFNAIRSTRYPEASEEGAGDLQWQPFFFLDYLEGILVLGWRNPGVWPPWAGSHIILCISRSDSFFKWSPGKVLLAETLDRDSGDMGFHSGSAMDGCITLGKLLNFSGPQCVCFLNKSRDLNLIFSSSYDLRFCASLI